MEGLIRWNIEHPQIVAGIQFIDDWLKDAFDSRPSPYRTPIARLWDAGVRGREILVETASIHLFSLRRPDRVLSRNHRLYLIGSKVIRIIPYWSQTSGPLHRSIGVKLERHLKPLYVKLCSKIAEDEDVLRQRKLKMAQPLII